MSFSRLLARRFAVSVFSPALVAVATLASVPAHAVTSLNPAYPPSRNFDLSHFKLTIPSGSDVDVDTLNSGYQLSNAFYTDTSNGGMVFRCPNIAGTTSNSHYSRSELRELLDPANGSSTADSNNWTTADGGTLRVRLRVDRVSTTGDSAKVGRVVIGQIHGPDTEVIRLYYTKLPGQAKGRIYAGMDDVHNNNTYSPDIVPNTGGKGIALGQVFSYVIKLDGLRLHVHVRLSSTEAYDYVKYIDPGYKGLNLYFKAGVYNQNNTGDSSDYVKATFFGLTHIHP